MYQFSYAPDAYSGPAPGQYPGSVNYMPGQYQGQYPTSGQFTPQQPVVQHPMQAGHYPSTPPSYPPTSYPHPGVAPQPNAGYDNRQQYPVVAPQPNSGYANRQQYPDAPTHHNIQEVVAKTPWNPAQASPYSGADIAEADVDENAKEERKTGPAPSYDVVVPGYKNVGAQIGPPPALHEESFKSPPANVQSNSIPSLTDDEARNALLELVSYSPCWGSRAARDMDIKDIVATNAFHYVLETFTEGRRTSYEHKPYKGGPVDAAYNGPAPLPWTIPCKPKALFKTEERKIPVPHTDVISACTFCYTLGYVRCGKCRGRGKVKCGSCHGRGEREVTDDDGNKHNEACTSCSGTGHKKCKPCLGTGCIKCAVCQGYGSITQFIQLTVTFTNRDSDHIIERTGLPNHLIRDVVGDTLFTQTHKRVLPIENFFESEINSASKRLVTSHGTSWPKERILKQRHHLRSIPVHECIFQYKEQSGRFWVYGHQKKVYTTDYPHTCCCCRCKCNIL